MKKTNNILKLILFTVLLGGFAGGVIWCFLKVVALCSGLLWETLPAHSLCRGAFITALLSGTAVDLDLCMRSDREQP